MKIFLMKAGQTGPYYLVLAHTRVGAADVLMDRFGRGADYSCKEELGDFLVHLIPVVLGVVYLDGETEISQKLEILPLPTT